MTKMSKLQFCELVREKKSWEEIRAQTGYTPKGFLITAGRYKVHLSAVLQEELERAIQKQRKRRPEYDALIAGGFVLEDIALRVGCRRQNVDQYVRRTGQQELYQQQRKMFKTTFGNGGRRDNFTLFPKFRQHYLYLLEERITQLCTEKGFAHQKAWEFLQKTDRRTNKSFLQLVKFFEGYEYAVQHDVKLSGTELGDYFGWSISDVSQILHKVRLETLCLKWKRSSISEFMKKKERVLRCFDLPLLASDIAYFSGISSASVQSYFNGIRKQKAKPVRFYKSGDFRSGPEATLTYHLSSRIYEADDAGFTLDEICEYAPTKSIAVVYAQEHRTEIEPVIITALQRLYPDDQIKVPYRNTYGIV